MNYAEALDHLAQGKKIRINMWHPYVYVSSGPIPYTPYLYNAGTGYRFIEIEWPSFSEIESTNWVLYNDLP